MNHFLLHTLLVIAGVSGALVQSDSKKHASERFNISTATCMNQEAASAIRFLQSKDFAAFEEDCTDGLCEDLDGTGYELGQELPMCGGCMILSCTSRPCVGRHGEKCEMFWSIARISDNCCQDCDGRVLEPNQELPPLDLHDECGTTEHAVCKAQWHSESGTQVGTMELTYTATDCCDKEAVGTEVVEPRSCSFRTCQKGLPAYWERTFLEIGACNCCEYNGTLYRNGECQVDDLCCCEGSWVRKNETTQFTETTTTTTITTTMKTTTTSTKTTTTTTTTTKPTTTTITTTTASTTKAITTSEYPVQTSMASSSSSSSSTRKFEKLTQCNIESLSFALDISGSMSKVTKIWKPTAINLVKEMARRQVNIDHHYLFTYVDTIQGVLTTTSDQTFSHTINSWRKYSGSMELTFAALKHAMEQVKKNAFVCVWTDEIGDDTNDAALKAEILTLKAETKSEIFIMAITPYQRQPSSRSTFQGTSASIMANQHQSAPINRKVKDVGGEDDKNKKRTRRDIAEFKAKFDDIGHVMDISNDENVVPKIIDIMKKTSLCTQIYTTQQSSYVF